jgi:hypothetical protein
MSDSAEDAHKHLQNLLQHDVEDEADLISITTSLEIMDLDDNDLTPLIKEVDTDKFSLANCVDLTNSCFTAF